MKLFLKRYRLFLIFMLFEICLFFFDVDIASKTAQSSFDNLIEMLSIIPPIFILLGLMDVWIPKETMMKYMGEESGMKGSILAFLLGSFSAGPLYASFPIASVFIKKGVSLFNVYIFVGAWSTTKIPMLLFEMIQLGFQFTITRFILNVIGITCLAYTIEKTTNQQERIEMNKLIHQQMNDNEKN